MPGPIAPTQECCQPDCDEVASIQVPGPAGADGADGATGPAGESAFTTLAAQFLMPAEGATVNAVVGSTAWMVVGQPLAVQVAGTMIVSSITNSITVVLQNPENTATSAYPANAVATTPIPAGSKISPSGVQGPAGALTGAAGGSLEGTYPNPTVAITTTKGDLIVNQNAAVAPRNTRLGVGTDGNNLEADSTTGTGLKWAPKNLAGGVNHVTGVLPIINGGGNGSTANASFNNLSPVTTRGDLIYRNATVNARLAIGTANQVLGTDGTDPIWAKLTPSNLGTLLAILPLDYVLLEYRLGSGTAGGTFTSGGWVTRELTTESVDTGSVGSLASNQYTFNSGGRYRFRGRACAYKVDNHQVRLFNITSGTTIASGSNARAAAAGDDITWSEVVGRATITALQSVELQHQCQTTRATDGKGLASSFGINEVYATLEFWKEAG